MKRIVIAALFLALVMSVSSMATQTRTLVMGNNDQVLVDDYNVFTYPGRVFNYPNLAIAEFDGGDDFYKFGINWQFGDENPTVVGTYVCNDYPIGPSGFMGNDYMNRDWSLYSNRRIDLLVGRQMGNNNIGLRVAYFSSGWEYDDKDSYAYSDADTSYVNTTPYKEAESFRLFVIGLGLTEGLTGQWDVAAQLSLGSWTDKDGNGIEETEPDGYYELAVGGRYFMVRNPKITFVPHAGFAIGKRGEKDYRYDQEDSFMYMAVEGDSSTVDMTEKQTLMGFDLGVGMHYTPAPNLLAVMDLGVMYSKVKREIEYSDTLLQVASSLMDYEETWKEFTLPYLKIGLEADVFKWMDVRLGGVTYWNSSKDELSASKSVEMGLGTGTTTYDWELSEGWASNYTYLGFAFHWNRLHVDTYTDPRIVLKGFDFITGSNDSTDNRDLNFQVSAVYEMF